MVAGFDTTAERASAINSYLKARMREDDGTKGTWRLACRYV
jgi:hypothetical protein